MGGREAQMAEQIALDIGKYSRGLRLQVSVIGRRAASPLPPCLDIIHSQGAWLASCPCLRLGPLELDGHLLGVRSAGASWQVKAQGGLALVILECRPLHQAQKGGAGGLLGG